MYSLRRSCTHLTQPSPAVHAWTRRYCSEWLEGQVRPSEKKKLLKVYEDAAEHGLPGIHVKHPKIAVPVKPPSNKHDPKTDPWLFLMGVFPKSVHDLNKEAEEKKLNPPGSEFQGVWLKHTDLEAAKRDRFAKELISFRNTYEKPVIDAFKEVDSKLEEEYRAKRFEQRKKKKAKTPKKKFMPGQLQRFMLEKEYWEKYISVLHVGNFADLPPKKESMDLMTFEAMKYDIGEPDYDLNLIKDDYGHHSDWSMSQHLALMIPDDEVEHLKMENLMPPEYVDQLYRTVKELEYVYEPVGKKLENIARYQQSIVDKDRADYLKSKGKEMPPKVWDVFNPEHIKEFDDVQDADSISLEEIHYRLDKAYESWTKRLFDPEVERRVRHYVKEINGGQVWSRFTAGGINRLAQFADQAIADERIFLKDADVVRVLKGQLVDSGLAQVVVKRRDESSLKKPVGGEVPIPASGGRPVPLAREKSPILTDDTDAYLEFVPSYTDAGTFLLPRKEKKIKAASLISEQEQFEKEINELDDRAKAQRHLPKKKMNKYRPAFEALMEYERMEPQRFRALKDEQEEELAAHREYEKWRRIWPHPQVGETDLEGAELEKFMKSDKWFPVNHLFYNHNVEFFTRTLPLAPELKPADKMRMRKVVMRVYVAPLELPKVVDKRLKELLGPRYNQAAKVVTLTGSDRHTQRDNKSYLKLLFREILHEAWLADPNYLPMRESPPPEPFTWKPSAASEEVKKPLLFRLFGAPLQTKDQQNRQLEKMGQAISTLKEHAKPL